MSSPSVAAIVLAAGKGTRMKSSLPKVLHTVGGVTLLEHAVQKTLAAKPGRVAVVVPADYAPLEASLQVFRPKHDVVCAVQKEQKGTAHAVQCGLNAIPASADLVLVINADMPLVTPSSLRRLFVAQKKHKTPVAFLTANLSQPHGMGRILRDTNGTVTGIVEEKDATAEQKRITEINTGLYLFEAKFLREQIGRVGTKNSQKEYYLTDLISAAVNVKRAAVAVVLAHEHESLGVNSQAELQRVNEVFYQEHRQEALADGVCILGNDVWIDASARVSSGVTLMSPCYIRGHSQIGQGSTIEPGCFIQDSTIESGVLLKAYSYITESKIGPRCQVGPFAHLRPGTVLKHGAKVGNFVETKKSVIGPDSKVNHLSYIGDAELGSKVNVGAGTITCNYDGYKKYKTVLEDGVFIGSDTQLVAPVKVGRGAFVGAGSTVTKDVEPDSLVVSRVPQREIAGWAKNHRQKNAKKS